ncbi:MAG TPA: hypothetical protein VN517_03705 [Terriglobales bacterium]|nr:hypothetical protein [Terriglobales bacterium]
MNWLFPYRTHLEAELKQQREDFAALLAEKDTQIRSLRIELAGVKDENERMRLVLMPLGSQAGQLYAAKFQPMTQVQPAKDSSFTGPQDWQGELNKMLQEEEDGIRSRGRIQEHKSGTDDGA